MKLNFIVLVGTIAVVCLATSAGAAEFRLRRACKPSGAVVCLGDVADVMNANQNNGGDLAALELFPAPTGTQKRTVTAREIQDALALRGVNLATHRFSGSSQVLVESPGEAPVRTVRATTAATKRATAVVREAVLLHLAQHASASEPWDLKFELTDAEVSAISAIEGKIVAVGGKDPWVGLQQFEVGSPTAAKPAASITVQVMLPPSVVVAIRPIARGAVLSSADVQMQRSGETNVGLAICQSLDEAVGHEALQPIAAGAVLETTSLRPPLMVRRGDLVTVYARSAGIQVTTKGKSRGDGSVGEVVEIESVTDKAKFFARVSGSQTVEVYARATSVGSDAAATR